MDREKLWRPQRAAGPAIRCGGVTGDRAPVTIPKGANQRRLTCFPQDEAAMGRSLRTLAMVDDLTCGAVSLVADTSIDGRRVARGRDGPVNRRCRPAMIRIGHGNDGPAARVVRERTGHAGGGWHRMAAGKPGRSAPAGSAATAGSRKNAAA